jgi:integrase
MLQLNKPLEINAYQSKISVQRDSKRDYVIIALLVVCALRRRELASLTIEGWGIEDIQLREKIGDHRSPRQRWTNSNGRCSNLGEAGNRSLDGGQDR